MKWRARNELEGDGRFSTRFGSSTKDDSGVGILLVSPEKKKEDKEADLLLFLRGGCFGLLLYLHPLWRLWTRRCDFVMEDELQALRKGLQIVWECGYRELWDSVAPAHQPEVD
ncbi:putative ribonuclease H protein [Corchorus olitorius]|uniref:Ribonuclease H protein n=1 Tax=Corchorus olitorius TaxID=93759 RepID=A0A1R3J1U7_9ROSI|nr:putative ribonuclease H protein [Corchorus olitorius]